MTTLNKVIQFFLTKYNNNLKYSNKMLFKTRIFFERTTKDSQTVSNLGNVYRNSKWSNLKIQNIKSNFFNQFLTMFFISLVLFILFFIIFIRFTSDDYSLIFLVPSKIWYILEDLFYYFFLFFITFFYSIYLKISTLFTNFFLKDLLKDTLKYNNRRENLNSNLICNIKNNNNLENNFVTLTIRLQKVIYNLNLLTFNKVSLGNSLNNIYNIDKTQFVSFIFLNVNKNYNLEKNKLFKIPKSNLEVETKMYSYTSSQKYINNESYLIQKLFLKNATQNLNLAKQNRWYLKSTILSDKTISKVNNITTLKKLLGTSSFNTGSMDSNIWLSNKITNNVSFNKFFKNNFFKEDYNLNKSLFTSNPININNFESSIFWITNRYKFLQLFSKNQQFLFSDNNVNSKETLNSKNTNFYNVYNTFLLEDIYALLNNFSFYKNNLFKINSNEINSINNNYIINLNLNSKEILSGYDLNFLKFIFTNNHLNKSNINFYSNLNV